MIKLRGLSVRLKFKSFKAMLITKRLDVMGNVLINDWYLAGNGKASLGRYGKSAMLREYRGIVDGGVTMIGSRGLSYWNGYGSFLGISQVYNMSLIFKDSDEVLDLVCRMMKIRDSHVNSIMEIGDTCISVIVFRDMFSCAMFRLRSYISGIYGNGMMVDFLN